MTRPRCGRRTTWGGSTASTSRTTFSVRARPSSQRRISSRSRTARVNAAEKNAAHMNTCEPCARARSSLSCAPPALASPLSRVRTHALFRCPSRDCLSSISSSTPPVSFPVVSFPVLLPFHDLPPRTHPLPACFPRHVLRRVHPLPPCSSGRVLFPRTDFCRQNGVYVRDDGDGWRRPREGPPPRSSGGRPGPGGGERDRFGGGGFAERHGFGGGRPPGGDSGTAAACAGTTPRNTRFILLTIMPASGFLRCVASLQRRPACPRSTFSARLPQQGSPARRARRCRRHRSNSSSSSSSSSTRRPGADCRPHPGRALADPRTLARSCRRRHARPLPQRPRPQLTAVRLLSPLVCARSHAEVRTADRAPCPFSVPARPPRRLPVPVLWLFPRTQHRCPCLHATRWKPSSR